MPIILQQAPQSEQEASGAAKGLHILQTIISIILLVWAIVIIGFALPIEHKYHGGWIFGLAWFPIILFAVIGFITMNLMPKKLIPSIISFAIPYIFIGINVYRGTHITLENFIVQSAMLQFTACMVGYTLQAVLFPIMYHTAGNRSQFIHEEVIPQLCASVAGFGVAFYAFTFLLSTAILTVSDLPLIIIGIIQGGITVGLAIHHHRND